MFKSWWSKQRWTKKVILKHNLLKYFFSDENTMNYIRIGKCFEEIKFLKSDYFIDNKS